MQLLRLTSGITLGWLALASTAALSAHGSHCGHHHAEHHHSAADDIIVLSEAQISHAAIAVATASEGALIQRLCAPAKVVLLPQQLIHVVPQVAGIVAAAYSDVGTAVQAGDTLALLDSREVAEARAAYLAAAKRMQVKLATYRREDELRHKQLSTEQEYWQAEVDATLARIDYELAQQHLYAMGMTQEEITTLSRSSPSQLRRYELRAPAAGTVLSHNTATGAYLSGGTAAYVLADLTTRWLEIDVPISFQAFICIGAAVHVSTSDGIQTDATVQYCKPIVEEKTRTLKVYATLPKQTPWHVGTFVTAYIDGTRVPHALVIPKSAIQTIDGAAVVFVRTSDGFAIRPVTIGASDNEQVAIEEGLCSGESYASCNTFLLKAEHEKDEAEHEH